MTSESVKEGTVDQRAMKHLATKHLGIRVPAALNKRLHDLARRENNRVSAATRLLLTTALDREDETRAALSPERR